ncbi:MAG: hypothetical protein GDA36_09895 [Rhodobacteraceae bacterium]|nr:hypothetical protein [Paracoccaceae bacterium]
MRIPGLKKPVQKSIVSAPHAEGLTDNYRKNQLDGGDGTDRIDPGATGVAKASTLTAEDAFVT